MLNGIINKLRNLLYLNQNNDIAGNDVKNWHSERYERIAVQRNLLFLTLIIVLLLSIISVFVTGYVINTRRFDPFVIQVDENSGATTIVNPMESTVIGGNDALAQYFIKKYIRAREGYNHVDFYTEAKRTIRLFSSGNVYRNYIGFIKNPEINPSLKYGQKNTTFLIVKSISKLPDSKQKYMVRFSVNETTGAKKSFDKIAVIEFDYVAMNLSEKDRDINPIGFQVNGYRVDDDSS